MGGASKEPPKQSKLAALAAARRKKENQTTIKSSTSSVALLDKLNPAKTRTMEGRSHDGSTAQTPSESKPRLTKEEKAVPATSSLEIEKEKKAVEDASAPDLESILAEPSEFAKVVCGIGLPSPPPIRSDIQLRIPYAEGAFAGPSPDDIVAQAQAASKGLNKGQKENVPKSTGESKAAGKKKKDVASGVAEMSISEGPRPKSPKHDKVDVLAEYGKAQGKRTANFVVIGKLEVRRGCFCVLTLTS